MMENYDRVLDLTNAGLDSNGALMEANEVRVNSLGGQINILTDKMLAFMDSFQPAIYSSVQFGIVSVDALTKVVSFVSNNFIPIMAGATTGVIAFKAVMNGFTFVEQIQWMGALMAETIGLTTATVGATTATIAFKVALGGIAGLAIGSVIAIMVKGFKNAKKSMDDLTQSATKTQESISKITSEKSQLSELSSQYDTLNGMLKYLDKDSQSYADTQTKLKEVQQEIATLYPSLITYIDDEGTAYATSKKAIDDYIVSQEELLNIQKESLKLEAETNYDNVKSSLEKSQSNRKEAMDGMKEYAEKIAEMQKKVNSLGLEEGSLAWLSNSDVALLITYQNEYEKLKNSLSTYDEEIVSATKTLALYDSVLGETKEQQDEVKESIEEMTHQADAVAEAFRTINSSASEFDSSDIKNATKSYVELAQKARDIQSVIDEINENGLHLDALSDASEYMESFTGSIDNTSEVIAHLNEQLQNTQEETYLLYANMLSNDEEYWQSANANSNEYFNNNIANTEEWANYQVRVYNDLLKMDALMNSSKVANYNGYFAKIAEGMKTELANAKNLAEAKVIIATKANEAIAEQMRALSEASYAHGIGNGEYHETADTGKIKNAIAEINSWKNSAIASIQGIDAIVNTAPKFTSSIGNMSDALSGASKEAEKLVEDLENIVDAYYDIENALKDVENALDLNKAKQENSTGRKRVELMREEVELLKRKQQLLSQQQTEMEKERDALKKTLQNNGFSFSDDGSITNYQKRLKELQSWANSLSGDNKENAIESVEGLVDVIERYTELIKDEIPNVVQSWEEMTTAIKEAEREQLDYVTQVQKDITSAIENELRKRTDAVKKELQKQQDLYNSQYDEEDWNRELSEGQRKIDEIKAQINALSRDTSLAGQLKLEQLKNDLIEQETLFNDMIREHEKELGNNRFDEEISNLEDALEEQLTSENLASLVNQALATGFVQIGDSVMELDTLMTDWLDDFGDGLYAVGDTLKSELIDQLVIAKELMSHIGITSLSNNAGMKSRTIDASGINSSVNLSIGNLLNIDGNLTEDLLPEVEVMLKNASQELLNKISSQLSFR